MATFASFVPRIPTIQAVQWSDDPEVVDDLRIWLNENYGPETEGLIAQYDVEGLSSATDRGWELGDDGRVFIKQVYDHFWANVGDWLVLQESPTEPSELLPMDNANFVNQYQES